MKCTTVLHVDVCHRPHIKVGQGEVEEEEDYEEERNWSIPVLISHNIYSVQNIFHIFHSMATI